VSVETQEPGEVVPVVLSVVDQGDDVTVEEHYQAGGAIRGQIKPCTPRPVRAFLMRVLAGQPVFDRLRQSLGESVNSTVCQYTDKPILVLLQPVQW
jgi:hypothetical protein